MPVFMQRGRLFILIPLVQSLPIDGPQPLTAACPNRFASELQPKSQILGMLVIMQNIVAIDIQFIMDVFQTFFWHLGVGTATRYASTKA
jgi:hypothetical protein